MTALSPGINVRISSPIAAFVAPRAAQLARLSRLPAPSPAKQLMLSICGPLQLQTITCGARRRQRGFAAGGSSRRQGRGADGSPRQSPLPPSSSDADAAEVMKQLASMQRFLGTLATKDDLDALKATVDAIEANAEATDAKYEDLKDDCQVMKKRLAATDRNVGAVAEGSVQQRRAMEESGLSVGQNIFITRVEQLVLYTSVGDHCTDLQLLLQGVVDNHAGFSATRSLVAEMIVRACSELKDPAQAAALLEKLQQLPPKAVDFAAEAALWAEVQTIVRNTKLSDWLKAYVHIMAQYSRFAAKQDAAALAAWLVKPSRMRVQPAFVLSVALSSGELRARLELDDTFELKWDFQGGPICPLLLRLRETKLSYRDFMEGAKQLQTAANVFGWTMEVANPGLLAEPGCRLQVEGIVTVAGSRPPPEMQEQYGSSSKGRLLPLKNLAGSSIRVTLA